MGCGGVGMNDLHEIPLNSKDICNHTSYAPKLCINLAIFVKKIGDGYQESFFITPITTLAM
jgi:hypothetical protein